MFSAFLLMLTRSAHASAPTLTHTESKGFFSATLKLTEHKSALFVLLSIVPFPFIVQWGEFRGLYCEGIGAVLGILVVTLVLYAFESKARSQADTPNTLSAPHTSSTPHALDKAHAPLDSKSAQQATTGHIFILGFCVALFGALVKIANTGLFAVIIVGFVYVYKRAVLDRSFLRVYVVLGIFSILYALPWALKGYMTSGMIAYPAGVGYIESLSWAVSNAQREGEVCWIMSWARDPGKNCVEVLSNYEWLKRWILMETRYFGWYFKYFVYGYWAALGLALALLLLPARFYTLKRYVEHIVLFVGIMLGVGFWAVSGPDPRFGMVYLIPLFVLLALHNLTFIAALKSLYLRLVGLVAFFATLTPWFLLRKVALVWIWGAWVVLKVFVDSNARYGRIKLLVGALLAIASFWASYALYGEHALNAMKDTKKVRPIFVQERTTDFGAKIYVRKDKLEEGFSAVEYEPLPTTPYWNPKIKLEHIMGRKTYINTNKE